MQIFSKRKQADHFNLEIYKKNKQLKQSEREAEKLKFSPLNLRKNVSFYVSTKHNVKYFFVQNETQLKPIDYKEKPD